RGGVTSVAAGLDRHPRHAGLTGSCERTLHEGGADASPVTVGIDDEDVDLAHAVLGVEPRADPSCRAAVVDRDVDALRLRVEHLAEVAELPFPPAVRIERRVHEHRTLALQSWEAQLPGAQCEIEQCLSVPWVVGDDLSHLDQPPRADAGGRLVAGTASPVIAGTASPACGP